MVDFDPTVNLGQIGVAISFIVTVVTVFANTRSEIKGISSRLDRTDADLKNWRDKVDREMEKQTDILIVLGKQDMRIDNQDKRMDELMKRMDAHQAINWLAKKPAEN